MAVRPAIVREVKHGRGLMELRGKLALVTGGSDGIGREIALQLQGAGAEVIVTGRSAEKLRAMAGLGFETVASDQIGRASCRERVGQYVSSSVVAGYLKKTIEQTTTDEQLNSKKRIKKTK